MEQVKKEVNECVCNGKCTGECCNNDIVKRTWKDWLGFAIVFPAMFALIFWLINKDNIKFNNVNNINTEEKIQKDKSSPPILFKNEKNI